MIGYNKDSESMKMKPQTQRSRSIARKESWCGLWEGWKEQSCFPFDKFPLNLSNFWLVYGSSLGLARPPKEYDGFWREMFGHFLDAVLRL